MSAMNHNDTKVLMIGVSEYPDDPSINSIPNVLANVEQLKSSLINTDIIGIPEANIIVSINEDKGRIERKLVALVNSTRDKRSTMIIYYSGHGILSSNDYKLYLTTHNTSKTYLEIDAINIDVVKSYIKRSRAERKIVILDCCHSGAFIDQAMSTIASKIQADINEFTGTYIMTSAASDELSLFPVKSPEKPTYFTGKLIEVLNEGLDNDSEFCSLRDIYDKIEDDFKFDGLPHPQQSNVNDADQLLFAINKKYRIKKLPDELAWELALVENTKWSYIDFRQQFPDSTFFRSAMFKIFELEDEESWGKAMLRANLSAFAGYIDNFPNGKYIEEANQKIAALRHNEIIQNEIHFWNQVLNNRDLGSFQSYLNRYPKGRFVAECNEEILDLSAREDQRRFQMMPDSHQDIRPGYEPETPANPTAFEHIPAGNDDTSELQMKRSTELELQSYKNKEIELEKKRLEWERVQEEEKKNEASRIVVENKKKELERRQHETKKKDEQLKQPAKKTEEKVALNKVADRQSQPSSAMHLQKPASQVKKVPQLSGELNITEEEFKNNGYNPKDLAILAGVIIVVVLIFGYIIKNI